MNLDYLKELFDYHYWAYRRVWECIENLDEIQYQQKQDYSMGSVATQMYHVFVSEFHWIYYLKNGDFAERNQYPRRSRYNTQETLIGFWESTESETLAYLDSLTDETINELVILRSRNEDRSGMVPRWKILMQLYGHGIDHRAQILFLLHQFGISTVEQDYLFYLRESLGLS